MKPKVRNENLVVQEMKDETLVYDLNINKAFCLNKTSKLVWHLCNGKRTFAEIADEMSRQMKQLVSEDVVYLAIEQLNKDGLLENDTSDEFDRHFGGMSRREVIKKVGFASLIALPIITGIIAPTAAHAQSGAAARSGVEGTCMTTADCQAGLTCKACTGCANNPACCRNSANFNFAFGTGASAGLVTNQTNCSNNAAAKLCCSGQGTFNPNSRECICN